LSFLLFSFGNFPYDNLSYFATVLKCTGVSFTIQKFSNLTRKDHIMSHVICQPYVLILYGPTPIINIFSMTVNIRYLIIIFMINNIYIQLFFPEQFEDIYQQEWAKSVNRRTYNTMANRKRWKGWQITCDHMPTS
jgi:hypothetical protein